MHLVPPSPPQEQVSSPFWSHLCPAAGEPEAGAALALLELEKPVCHGRLSRRDAGLAQGWGAQDPRAAMSPARVPRAVTSRGQQLAAPVGKARWRAASSAALPPPPDFVLC